MTADPNESNPQNWPDESAHIRELLGKTIAAELEAKERSQEAELGYKLRGPKVAPDLEPHQLEALKSLGYVE